MRYVIALSAVLGLLLLSAGVITGFSVMDARRARAQLREEHAEFSRTLSELSNKLEVIQAKADRVASAKEEAITAWRLQSRLAQLTDQSWPPPRAYRGVGGPGPTKR